MYIPLRGSLREPDEEIPLTRDTHRGTQ